MLINFVRRSLLVVLVLGTLWTSYYVYDGFARRRISAQGVSIDGHRPEPGKHVSYKARIEHLGPDGEIEWSLEAEKMEFTFSESGELNGIDCFENVIYIRGDMTVRAQSCRYDMEKKRFTFDGASRP